MSIFKAIIEKLISGAMPENFEDYAERPLNEILESLAELEKIAVNPCFASPVEYARIILPRCSVDCPQDIGQDAIG